MGHLWEGGQAPGRFLGALIPDRTRLGPRGQLGAGPWLAQLPGICLSALWGAGLHSDQLRQHHANPHPPSSLGRSGDATLPAISWVVGPLRDSQLRPQGRVCAKARSPRTAGLAVSRGTMSVGEVQASQMPCCTPGVVGIGLPLQPVSRLARRPGSARRAGLGPWLGTRSFSVQCPSRTSRNP